MFNWICPECGREVSPSATECRFCAERKKAAETAVPFPAPVPPPAVDPSPAYSAPPPPQQVPLMQAPPAQPMPQYRPDAQAYAPPQPQQPYYAPPPPQQPQPYYPPAGYPPAKPALPTWAMALLFALAFIGVGAAIFFGYQYFGRGPRAERAGVTEPAAAERNKPS